MSCSASYAAISNPEFYLCLQAYSDGTADFPGPLLSEQEKKKGRSKRPPKGGDKPVSRYKKRKKEGDEKLLSGPDTVMTQIKQVR